MTYLPELGKAIWPWFLALDWPEAYFEPVLLYLITLAIFVIANLTFGLIYYLEWEVFERYKINLNPWPWKQNKKEFQAFVQKTIGLVIFNKLVFVPILLAFNAFLNDFKCPFSYSTDTLPDSLTFFLSFVFCLIMECVFFSASHQMLHHKAIYPYIHKVHHQYVTTIAISTEYAHPVEYLFGNILPIAIGPMILGKHIHLFTVACVYSLHLIESVEAHSGYQFSWSPLRVLPFFTDEEYHDFHHSHNVGNYSEIWLWDTFFGTNKDYYKYLELK